jgi:hypothetical protein
MSDAQSAQIVDLAAYRAARSTEKRAPGLLLVERSRPLQARAIDHRARMLQHLEAVASRSRLADQRS